MKYERSKPLPPKEGRFEHFYIRYDVHESDGLKLSLDAEVWETCEWASDGRPVFFNAGPNAPGMDPAKIEPTFTFYTKCDGCSHLWVRDLHFDHLAEFDAFSRAVRYIYDDIREREGVAD